MSITRKIGERFTLHGKTLEVKECPNWYSCQGCVFQDKSHPSFLCYTHDAELLDQTGECSGMARTDKKYVLFSLVNEAHD